ncbi:hypothetical protein A8F94_19070 [Bacillus sp. FJAT-27225]|uniref:hypothetical protein n=1 Tax=Bacillus sp. FJAT-27225 TaxID=1743144 RepID=UPI00080C2106|nr:hypothetical protein [Bacillus sp. FJAT-27225]OCA83213.1 hypothetical protein A8F94_19070 [Bacillus sp. FJAT-27225]
MPNQTKSLLENQKLFISIALGGNPFLHPSIDEAYRKNQWEYYEAYLQSGLKGKPLISMYSTRNEEKIRQVAGIVEWCYTHNHFTALDGLIKKGYKFAWLFVQRNEEIDFEQYIRAYAKRQKYRALKEIELFYQNIVLWYLTSREGKPIQSLSVTWQSFQEMLHSSLKEAKVQELNFSERHIEENREKLLHLYEIYSIPKDPEFDSLGAFLEYMLGVSLRRVYEQDFEFDSEEAQQRMFQVSPGKYIGALGGWLKALGINELDATEQIPFTKHALDCALLELLYAKKYNDISDDEQDLFFVASLYLHCVVSLYKEAKQFYLDESKQDYYVEMKTKEAAILQQEAELLRNERTLQTARKRHESERAGLEKELREAQAKIRHLEQKIEGMEDYAGEVHALREYLYWEEAEDQFYEKAPSVDKMAELIASKRIIVFGGSPAWQQKVKDVLPSVEFFDIDSRNRQLGKIRRADAVFINTSALSHAFYYKIMKELRGSGVPFYYIKGQSNSTKTIMELYKWITN